MKIIIPSIDDPIPLKKMRQISTFLIIVLIFQFTFFYTPVLAQNNKTKTYKPNIYVKNIDISNKGEKSSEITIEKKEIPSAHIVINVSKHVVTAYNSEKGQTDSTPCITANNFNVCTHGEEDTVAANFLPFGTKIMIPEIFGERVFIVRDRMNKKHSNRIDVWMKNKQDALNFGVKYTTILIIK